jgi:acyl-CoA synthetase (AMP-forming)/AMP-acid ligase II
MTSRTSGGRCRLRPQSMAEPPIEHLADLTRVQARVRPDRCALVQGERRTSYAELDAWTNRLAQALLAEGLEPGARVAWMAKDSALTFAFALACAKARVVLLGVNWRLSASEVAYVLEDSGAAFLAVGAEFAEKIATLAPLLQRMRRVVVVDGSHALGSTLEAWSASASERDPALPVSPEDVVVQMYTSGTTGRPKGVQLAHRSFFAVRAALRAADDPWIGWSADDVSLMNIPAFHIGGLWWAMTGLGSGACNVVMESFVGWKLLELIAARRVTKVCMVPAMIQVALTEPSAATTDFSSLRCVVYGGSPIPRPLLERAMQVFGCDFAQIYGLTETGNTAVCLRPADHRAGERLRAAGRPYPGVSLRCTDASGRDLPTRAVGEIWIRSPANMVGYWKNPDATAQTLVDGWIRTGDAGYLDEEGYLFIHDRVKDMIIYAGENIYPAEIESVLCAHPAVLEAAVIGVPDERWGELVRAIVVKRPGQDVTPRELLAFARRDLADFKLPKFVDFVDALPRTPSGKIKKAELRAPFWRGRERNVN